jgi:hypothetical protein
LLDYKCNLYRYISDNKIGDLPIEFGELKEKKVRIIELEDNPLNDPKEGLYKLNAVNP